MKSFQISFYFLKALDLYRMKTVAFASRVRILLFIKVVAVKCKWSRGFCTETDMVIPAYVCIIIQLVYANSSKRVLLDSVMWIAILWIKTYNLHPSGAYVATLIKLLLQELSVFIRN